MSSPTTNRSPVKRSRRVDRISPGQTRNGKIRFKAGGTLRAPTGLWIHGSRGRKSTPGRSAARMNDNIPQILLLLFADEYMFYKAARSYYRNSGNPLGLRLQLRRQFEQSAEWIEAITERIRELRKGADVRWMDFIKTARYSLAPGDWLLANCMLSELIHCHERLIAQLRTDIDACLQLYGDPATAGFLTGLEEQHESAVWMLRTQLQNTG